MLVTVKGYLKFCIKLHKHDYASVLQKKLKTNIILYLFETGELIEKKSQQWVYYTTTFHFSHSLLTASKASEHFQ